MGSPTPLLSWRSHEFLRLLKSYLGSLSFPQYPSNPGFGRGLSFKGPEKSLQSLAQDLPRHVVECLSIFTARLQRPSLSVVVRKHCYPTTLSGWIGHCRSNKTDLNGRRQQRLFSAKERESTCRPFHSKMVFSDRAKPPCCDCKNPYIANKPIRRPIFRCVLSEKTHYSEIKALRRAAANKTVWIVS
jgi:hypothetical protein